MAQWSDGHFRRRPLRLLVAYEKLSAGLQHRNCQTAALDCDGLAGGDSIEVASSVSPYFAQPHGIGHQHAFATSCAHVSGGPTAAQHFEYLAFRDALDDVA
jgi:hypothetical protein